MVVNRIVWMKVYSMNIDQWKIFLESVCVEEIGRASGSKIRHLENNAALRQQSIGSKQKQTQDEKQDDAFYFFTFAAEFKQLCPPN